MEHMGCRQYRLSVFSELYVGSQNVTVSAKNPFCFRIPYDELLIRVVHRVEFIDVHRKTASSAGISEGFFTETAYFPHHIR